MAGWHGAGLAEGDHAPSSRQALSGACHPARVAGRVRSPEGPGYMLRSRARVSSPASSSPPRPCRRQAAQQVRRMPCGCSSPSAAATGFQMLRVGRAGRQAARTLKAGLATGEHSTAKLRRPQSGRSASGLPISACTQWQVGRQAGICRQGSFLAAAGPAGAAAGGGSGGGGSGGTPRSLSHLDAHNHVRLAQLHPC